MRFLSVLLSLVMVLSGMLTGMPDLTLTAYADTTGGVYSQYIRTGEDVTYGWDYNLITFNGMQWNIIEDNSTSWSSGTVTLLAKDYIGASIFGDTTEYASSTVKSYLATYYSTHFSGLDAAVVNGELGRLYLLSEEEALTISNSYVLECSDCESGDSRYTIWWLRSEKSEESVAIINCESVDEYYIGNESFVRPALKLNLEAVEFSSETKTFTYAGQHIHNFSYTANGNTITATCNGNDCTLLNHQTTLTLSAEGGPYDGTTSYGATISDSYHIRGSAQVGYYTCNNDDTRGAALDPITSPPQNAGKYWAEITIGTGGQAVTAHVIYTIDKAVPTIFHAPEATAIYGQSLGDITLTNPAGNTDGTWAFVEAATTSVGDVGTHTFEANFTPADSANYDVVSNVNITVTVNKADPSVTAPQAVAIYGQTLGDISLTNPAGNTDGTWAFVDDEDTSVGDVGTHTFKANFTPTDTTNYNVASNVDITVTVNKADPGVTAPQAVATYGQTLGDITLTNPAGNPEGTWAFADAATTGVGTVGTHTFKASFTPADSANYNVVSNVDITVTVNREDLNVTAPEATATYGQTLGDITLTNPAGNPEGTWTFADAADTSVGDVGTHTFQVNFTPEDSETCNPVNGVYIMVTVNKADLNVTAPQAVATYGQTLDDITLTNPAGNPEGTWAFADAATTGVGTVGTHTFKANFTPADTAHYNVVSNVDITVTVNKADLTVTAPQAVATYGQTLGDITLTNPAGNPEGSWAFADAATTGVGAVGTHTFKANFTPTDTTHYNVVSNVDITVTVNKADPSVTAPQAVATYGQTLDDITLTNPAGNPEGTWSFVDDEDTSVGDAGEQIFKATFTPTDTTNYNTVSNVSVKVVVDRADNPATIVNTAVVRKGGKTIDLADHVKLNGAAGVVSYEISGENNDCTLNGSVLTTGNEAGNVTVNVAVAQDENYNALSDASIIVTIKDKDVQIISADDVTVTYGDTNKRVIATVSGNSTIGGDETIYGNGDLSYAVEEGSENYIAINKTSGELTIKKAGTATVLITAAETGDFARADAEVTVTILPADSSVTKAPEAESLTYTGEAQQLVTKGTAAGGTMQYAFGTETEVTGIYDDTIPAETNAGTYYVWYTVVGDENHNSTTPTPVKVEIRKANGPATVEKTATAYINGKPLDISACVKDAAGEVTYAIKDTLEGCSVDANTGAFTQGSKQGECTVAVTIAQSDNYEKQTEEIIVSVLPKPQVDIDVIQEDGVYGSYLSQPTYYIKDTWDVPTDGEEQIRYSGTLKKDGSNYDSEEAPTEAGDYTVVVFYENDTTIYTGTKGFQIAPLEIEYAEITLSDTELIYTGSEQTVDIIRVTLGERELTAADYTVSGNQATDADDYTLTVSANDAGNYTGSITKAFTIKKGTPYVKTYPTAEAITYGQTLADSVLSDGAVQISETIETPVAGTFAWKEQETKPVVSDSGVTKYEVVFIPEDSKNLESVTIEISLQVTRKELHYADLIPTSADETVEAVYDKLVTFNGMQWYIIEDNSTSQNSGTVTLLAKNHVGISIFGTSTEYVGSDVQSYLTAYYNDHFSGLDNAVVEGEFGRLYLLSADEAKTLSNSEVIKCTDYEYGTSSDELEGWWLRTSASKEDEWVVFGSNRACEIYDYGDWIGKPFCVRPALKLNLEAVDFSFDTKTFTPKQQNQQTQEDTNPSKDETETEKEDKQNTTTETPKEKEPAVEKETTVTPENPGTTKTTETPGTSETPKKQESTKVQAEGAKISDAEQKAEYVVISKAGETPSVAYKPAANAKDKTIRIPESVTVDGVIYQVTAIVKNAFKGNKTVQTIVVPAGVTVIGKNAFAGAKKLKKAVIKGSVKSIGSSAFKGCVKLKTLTISEGVETIGDQAFAGCTALGSVTIPKSVKKIGKKAFFGCSSLKKIQIKTTSLTAKTVGSKAFAGVNKKVSVKAPKNKKAAYDKLLKKKGLPK